MIKVEVTVEKDSQDKRHQLVAMISMALIMSGSRVTAGDYVVTIEKKPRS